jgi:hypothetical protein
MAAFIVVKMGMDITAASLTKAIRKQNEKGSHKIKA